MGCSKRLAEIYVQSLGCAIREGKVKGHTKLSPPALVMYWVVTVLSFLVLKNR